LTLADKVSSSEWMCAEYIVRYVVAEPETEKETP
jgi:hypothetical protein